MTHDPLCPIINTTCINGPHVLILEVGPGYYLCDSCECECQCDLIDKVREHIASEIIQYGKDTHPPHNAGMVCQRCDIVAAYNYAAKMAKGK